MQDAKEEKFDNFLDGLGESLGCGSVVMLCVVHYWCENSQKNIV